ncbi:MAG: hypothetical protein U5L08_04405 [Xanthomonadales bacterium]|nr:hypothetical protein [Xanthomonadales bacterium]
MIIDKALQVSDKQAVTATAASTDVVDFGQANPNLGNGAQPTYMVVTVDEAATATGDATVQFAVQDSADDSTFDDVALTKAIGKADLAAGEQIVIPMPVGLRRYARLNYTVATGPLTAGKFSAQIVTGVQQNNPQPNSPNIA